MVVRWLTLALVLATAPAAAKSTPVIARPVAHEVMTFVAGG